MAPAAAPPLSLPCEWHMDEAEWYKATLAHWASSDVEAASNEGVLGGWAEVDAEDALGSLAFLELNLGSQRESWPIADSARWTAAPAMGASLGACSSTSPSASTSSRSVRGCCSRQRRSLRRTSRGLSYSRRRCASSAPPPDTYHLIWAQWVLGHLTDSDVVALLTRCRQALRPGGAIVVKDNATTPSFCDQGEGR